MKALKAIAANLVFICGALLLMPLVALSWLLDRASKGVDTLGYAISGRLPRPQEVFSEDIWYWFWQAWGVCFFLWCLLSMLALMAEGKPLAMLWQLAMAMTWSAIITRNWERRNCSVSHMPP